MATDWRYVSGDWNVICDVCGKKIKASKSRKRWDGFVVCEDDFEYRHPQDFVRAKQDKISVPFTRPRPTDVFINPEYVCTLEGSTAVTRMAVAGCSVAGRVQSLYICTIEGRSALAGNAVSGCSTSGKPI